MEIEYFDYQEQEGVKYPMSFKMIDNTSTLKYQIISLKFNENFNDDIFQLSTYCE